jgi:cytosine deaminase
MDVIIKNCRLLGAEKLFDVEIDEGKITGIREKSRGGASEEIDAGGRLLAPSFLNMHFHLDTVLTA